MSPIKPLYLIVDFGTGSLRASLFSPSRGIVAMEKKELAVGQRVDAERVWGELIPLVRSLADQAQGLSADIISVGVSSLLGWVALGGDGQPVADAWTWMDQETAQFEKLRHGAPQDFLERTGRRFNSELAALKWRALKENEPALYDRVSAFVSLKDYFLYRITGCVGMDYTSAAYTGLFSISAFRWDPVLLRWFGLDAGKLPELRYGSEVAGTVTAGFAAVTGLRTGIPVVAGGPDGSMAILGGGGVAPGDVVDVMGSTDVCFGVSAEPILNREGALVNNPHLLPNLWLTGGPMGMTGGTVRWFAGQWGGGIPGNGEEALHALEKLASEAPAGSSGLLFIPSLTGERTPTWNSAIRGTIAGLTQYHDIGHIYRALLEGNGYTLNLLFSQLESAGYAFTRYTALGGGAKNRLALQIRADITGKRIIVPKAIEASTLGVAILCALATGDFADAREAVGRLIDTDFAVEPDKANEALYRETFARYRKLLVAMGSFYSAG